MSDLNLDSIRKSVAQAATFLLEAAHLKPGQLLVVGCSTSEIQGHHIGKFSSEDVGIAVYEALMPLVEDEGLYLAAQGCEHLNRALVVEEAYTEKNNLEIVNAVPQLHAGGGFAITAYARFQKPVMVERVVAHAGMDIGDTLIGMHLRPVAVPVRCDIKSIGEAHLTLARTRHRMIGGERAGHYRE